MARKRTGIMLAKPATPELIEQCSMWYIQPKLNGMRCRAELLNGNVKLYSSTGVEIMHLPHIIEELKRLRVSEVFDGELYKHGMPLADILSRTRRTVSPHPEATSIEYHIFDQINMKLEQYERTENHLFLQTLIESQNLEYIKAVRTELCHRDDIVEATQRMVEAGYEGIILRHPDSFYIDKRSTSLLKIKPLKTLTFPAVSFHEAISQDGHQKDMLGALTLRMESGRTFRCGAFPLGHIECERLWQLKKAGKLKASEYFAKVTFPEYTKYGHPSQPILKTLIKEGHFVTRKVTL